MKDEYEEIYGQYEGSGFLFAYAGGKIGRSVSLPKGEVDKIDARKRNKDDVPLFVRCSTCGEYMDFSPGPENLMDGTWVCPTCKATVKESAPYRKLSKENDRFLTSNRYK